MNDDDVLAEVDLQAWRVPPPAPLDRSSLLVRALSPAAGAVRRPRLRWLIAGIVLANAALAALIVIVFARPARTQTVMTVLPAGGSSVDATVAELLQRLQQEQDDLERKVREIQDLRAVVTQLSEKARQCEERDRTIPKPPPVVPQPAVAPAPLAPQPTESCDEVSCVLNNYPDGCCTKYRRDYVAPKAPPGPPEALDRAMILNGVASVKATISACTGAKGVVKVRVRVGANGLVTNVEVASTPDTALGGCVAKAMQRAVFPRTKTGGSFSYPFVF